MQGIVRLTPYVRWWSVVSLLKRPTKQGTPVQDRDGPAAVTECVLGKLIRAIVGRTCPAWSERRDNEKASFSELGSQKTYQRVFGSLPRGTEAAECLLALGRR